MKVYLKEQSVQKKCEPLSIPSEMVMRRKVERDRRPTVTES